MDNKLKQDIKDTYLRGLISSERLNHVSFNDYLKSYKLPIRSMKVDDFKYRNNKMWKELQQLFLLNNHTSNEYIQLFNKFDKLIQSYNISDIVFDLNLFKLLQVQRINVKRIFNIIRRIQDKEIGYTYYTRDDSSGTVDFQNLQIKTYNIISDIIGRKQ